MWNYDTSKKAEHGPDKRNVKTLIWRALVIRCIFIWQISINKDKEVARCKVQTTKQVFLRNEPVKASWSRDFRRDVSVLCVSFYY